MGCLGHLRPGPHHPPLGGAGVSVADPAGFGPVVVAVLVVDGAGGVVLQWLHAAHRADLHPRLSAGFAAVLPVSRHPAAEQSRDIPGEVGGGAFGPHKLYKWSKAHMGGGQSFWLQSLTSPLGFMLDLLQKLLWTILLSTFLLQPYRRYCFPAAREKGGGGM